MTYSRKHYLSEDEGLDDCKMQAYAASVAEGLHTREEENSNKREEMPPMLA